MQEAPRKEEGAKMLSIHQAGCTYLLTCVENLRNAVQYEEKTYNCANSYIHSATNKFGESNIFE